MEQNQNHPERKKGPIHKMIDWTIGIIFCISLVGLAWRHIILPLFTLGGN